MTNDLLLAQNVPPKAGVPGTVQDTAPAASGGGASAQSPLAGFMPILMMLVIFVPFFFLMNRKQKKESQARASLKKGDRVMTNAGLIGELMETDERVARVGIPRVGAFHVGVRRVDGVATPGASYSTRSSR